MANTRFQVVTLISGETRTVDFGSTVLSASVAVQGYKVSYGNTDGKVQTLDVQASMQSISGNSVSVSATCTMENDGDKHADGEVTVLVIAECDSE